MDAFYFRKQLRMLRIGNKYFLYIGLHLNSLQFAIMGDFAPNGSERGNLGSKLRVCNKRRTFPRSLKFMTNLRRRKTRTFVRRSCCGFDDDEGDDENGGSSGFPPKKSCLINIFYL